MANWLDLSSSSNLFRAIYVKGFVDISGGDFISRNGNLYIAGNSTVNNNSFVQNQLGIGVSGSLHQLDVSGSANFRSNIIGLGDASINGNLYLITQASGDSSSKAATTAYVKNQNYATVSYVSQELNNQTNPTFIGTVVARNDTSLNGNLTVGLRSTFNGDVSINKNVTIAKDAIILGNTTVSGKSLFNNDISINGDIIINGNIIPGKGNSYNLGSVTNPFNSLYINTNTIYFTNDEKVAAVSFNTTTGGLDISANGQVTKTQASLNGNIAYGNLTLGNAVPQTVFDVSGSSTISGTLAVGSDVSMNGNVVINGNLTVNRPASNINFINTTITNYQMIVSEDISLNGRLLASSDVSMNGRLFVSGQAMFAQAVFAEAPISSTISTNGNSLVNKNYVDASINALTSTLTSQITGANVAMKTYTDASINSLNSTLTSQITGANVAMKTYTDASINSLNSTLTTSIVNANVALQNYTDASIGALNTTLTSQITNANVAMKTYTDASINSLNSTLTTSIVNANVAMKTYTDTSINALNSTLTSQITNANIALKSYTDTSINASNTTLTTSITNANIALKSYTDASINSLNSTLTTLISSNYATKASPTFTGIVTSTNDVSMNQRLFVRQDTSLNGNLYVKGNSTFTGAATFTSAPVMSGASISASTIPNSALATTYIDNTSTQTVGGLKTFTSKTTFNDISANGNVVIYGNLTVQQVRNANIINTTTNTYQLIVSEDISLNGRLFVSTDASINGKLYVAGTTTINGVATFNTQPTIPGYATLASPALSGTPIAPTPGVGTNSTQVATTAFVATSFAPLANPSFTGTPTAPTAAAGTNSTQLATTGFVSSNFLTTTNASSTYQTQSGMSNYAPLNAPTFTNKTTFNGDVSMNGNIAVNGATVLNNTLTIGGNSTTVVFTNTNQGAINRLSASSNNQYILLCTGSTTVVLSTNGGTSYTTITTFNGMSTNNCLVSTTGQYMAISSYTKLYLSTNYGSNWAESTALTPLLATNYANINEVAISTNGQSILVVTGYGPYLSTNGGTTWSKPSYSGSPINSSFYYCAMSDDGQYMVICPYGNGSNSYLSTNSGSTWTLISSSGIISSTQNIYGIKMSSTGQYIVAQISYYNGTATESWLAYSSNYGTSWTQMRYTNNNSYYSYLNISADGQRITYTVDNTIYISSDSGVSWSTLSTSGALTSFSYPSVFLPRGSNYIYVINSYTAYYGTLPNNNGIIMDTSGNMSSTGKLAVNGDATLKGNLYLKSNSLYVGGTLFTGGSSNFTTDISVNQRLFVLQDTSLNGNLYVGNKSTFNGVATFNSQPTIPGYATLASPALSGTPTAPTPEAGTNTTQVATTAFVTTNYAPLNTPTFTNRATFTGDVSMNGNIAVNGVTVLNNNLTIGVNSTTVAFTNTNQSSINTLAVSSNNQYILLCSNSSTLLSTNGGISYTTITTFNGMNTYICKMSTNGQYMAIVASNTLYLSTNFGSSWTTNSTLSTIVSNNFAIMNAVAISANGQSILVVTMKGPYLTTNGGTTWSQQSYSGTMITSDSYYCAMSDDGQCMIVAPSSDGSNSYLSTNGGTTWTIISSSGVISSAYYVNGITMSSTGQYIVAIVSNFNGSVTTSWVAYSNNYGTSWTQQNYTANNTYYTSINISANGQIITFSTNNAINISYNSGGSWTTLSTSGALTSVSNPNLFLPQESNYIYVINSNNVYYGTLPNNNSIIMDTSGNMSSTGKLAVDGDATLNGKLYLKSNSLYVGGTLFTGGSSNFTTDVSVNQRLFVLQDTSLNGNLYVANKSTFNGDISANGNVVIYGNLTVQQQRNASIINTTINNYQLVVTDDISLNGRLFVSSDVSLGGKLYVTGAATFVAQPTIPGYLTSATAASTYQTQTGMYSYLTSVTAASTYLTQSNAATTYDTIATDKTITGAKTFTSKTTFNDISANGNVVIYGNLTVQQTKNTNVINTTTNNYQLIVSEDISLNGRLMVSSDASFGGNVIVTGNIVGTNLIATSGNVTAGNIISNNSVKIITSGTTILNATPSGVTVNGTLSTGTGSITSGPITATTINTSSSASVNTLYVSSDATITGNQIIYGNISIGTNTPVTALDIVGQGMNCGRVTQFDSNGYNTNLSPGGITSYSANLGYATFNPTADITLTAKLSVALDTSLNANIYVANYSKLTAISEKITAAPTFGSSMTFNLNQGAIFTVSPTSNMFFTAQITNVPSDLNRTFVVTLLIDSSTYNSYASAVTINGTSIGLIFPGGPTSIVTSLGGLITQTIAIINTTSGTPWKVLSTVTSYYG